MNSPKFGIQLRNFPSELEDSIFERILEVGRNCENLGYDSIWMVDHLMMNPPIAYESQPIPDCWTTIALLAGATSRIRVGSLVTCGLFRQGGYLARVSSTIQEISNGRLIVGLGSGWYRKEFDAYGIPFPNQKGRLMRLRSVALDITKSNRSSATRSPQLWIGGSGELGTLKIVSELGDACSVFGDPATVARKFEIIRRYCSSYGRNEKEIIYSKHSNVVIGQNENLFRAELSKIVPDESKWKDFVRSNIVGTPEDCRKQIIEYSKAGVDYFTLSFPDIFDLDSLSLFQTEVARGITEEATA